MPVLPYTVREGLKGLRRATFAAIASMSAMAVALVLVGTFAMIIWEAREVAEWLRDRVGEMEVYLDLDVDDRTGRTMHARIELMPGVASAEYISRERAVEIFRTEFGEGAEAFFDEPFLPASVRVRIAPAWTNADSIGVLRSRFQALDRVDEVEFNQELLLQVQSNLQLVTWVGLGAGLLVLLASIFLVANTIRLTIYARRLLIRTMKLVGATDRFIRRPFLVEGVIQGLLSGIIAALVVYSGGAVVTQYLPELFTARMNYLPVVAVGVVIVGIMLGWAGSLLSVRRFIRRVALH